MKVSQKVKMLMAKKKVEIQHRNWTFYEAIYKGCICNGFLAQNPGKGKP